MRTVHASYARTHFSALVAAAERGEPTLVTKHGRPAAVVIPVDVAKSPAPTLRPSFVDVLMSFPGGIDLDRNDPRLREVDL